MDDFSIVTWLVSYRDKVLEPGCPLASALVFPSALAEWISNSYEPGATAVCPIYFSPPPLVFISP